MVIFRAYLTFCGVTAYTSGAPHNTTAEAIGVKMVTITSIACSTGSIPLTISATVATTNTEIRIKTFFAFFTGKYSYIANGTIRNAADTIAIWIIAIVTCLTSCGIARYTCLAIWNTTARIFTRTFVARITFNVIMRKRIPRFTLVAHFIG